MPKIVFDTGALAENSRRLRLWASAISLDILPVLKAVSGFKPAVETLQGAGFARFGLAKADEDGTGFLSRQSKTLIQLTALSGASTTVSGFGRSLESSPEVLRALDQMAGAVGLIHEILLMVNLGDNREGLEPSEVADVLDLALALPNLKFRGFGAILTCLGNKLPDRSLFADLRSLIELSASRGVFDPVLSLGGTVMFNFVDQEGRGPITELRLGDPFLLGIDVYRRASLPGGPWRRDVCLLEAEVVETSRRPRADGSGLADRALLDCGRFHVGHVQSGASGYPPLDGLECLWPGAVIVGATAGYLVLDLSNCPERPKVGETVSFRPGYWAIAQSFMNPGVSVTLASNPDSRDISRSNSILDPPSDLAPSAPPVDSLSENGVFQESM
jgi:predicted amino acid racemase